MSTRSSSSPAIGTTGMKEPSPEAKAILKSKGKSSITPRTFKRFFTPRHRVESPEYTIVSRHVLGDLTSTSVNRLASAKGAELPRQPSRSLFDRDENPICGSNILPSNSKESLFPLNGTDTSRPAKRRKVSAVDQCQLKESKSCAQLPSEILSCQPDVHASWPVRRSQARQVLGETLLRELRMSKKPCGQPLKACYLDFRSETSKYHSRPEDVHVCKDPFASRPNLTLPFCVVACNTNPLVAVGDDEGIVRLIETRNDDHSSVKRSYLAFRPHNNAILDMAFSTDDSILATASADQTCQILNMQTQQATHALDGHVSSVKQIRFQPGSCDSVIATSGRDGSIQVWDLRYAGRSRPAFEVQRCLEDGEYVETKTTTKPTVKHVARISAFSQAHAGLSHAVDRNDGPTRASSLSNFPGRRSMAQTRTEVSVTAISFLSPSNSHLLLSGGEAEATVKLWDLRMTRGSKRKSTVPISTTRRPEAHHVHRHFGLTSMALSGDGARLYTLCKDNTVYVYSTSHLVLGCSPDFEGTSNRLRWTGPENEGLGPVLGFRHPQLKVSTFYVKLSVRQARQDREEMIATGSTDSCAVLFPTRERYFSQFGSRRSLPSCRSDNTNSPDSPDRFPIYQAGTPLVRGHENEVTGVAWSSEGNLLTVGDDNRCRVWRGIGDRARELRVRGEADGNRWGHGWAEGYSDVGDQSEHD